MVLNECLPNLAGEQTAGHALCDVAWRATSEMKISVFMRKGRTGPLYCWLRYLFDAPQPRLTLAPYSRISITSDRILLHDVIVWEPLTTYELVFFFRERLPQADNALAASAPWFASRASRASLNLA